MAYKIANATITDEQLSSYLESSVNRFFAILGIFEDCEKLNDFSTFNAYLDRLIVEFSGASSAFNSDVFISLLSILKGIREKNDISHKEVKSLVFHSISLIKRGVIEK